MNFVILTIFPQMFQSPFAEGVVHRAVQKEIINIHTIDIRDFAENKHRRVDDAPFGGDDGMVFLPEPLFKCMRFCKKKFGPGHVVFMTPSGTPLTHNRVVEIAENEKTLYIVCGRYAGIDQRFIDEFVDEELSIGDYVISGGELAGMILVDALARQVDGVLGNQDSVANDSFSNGLLEYPLYTRPANFEGRPVPEVLLSGNHGEIKKWRVKESLRKTKLVRPDLLKGKG